MRVRGRIVLVASVFLGSLLLMPAASRAQMRTPPVSFGHPAYHPIPVAPSGSHGIAVPRARINTAVSPPARAHARSVTSPSDEFGNAFGVGSGETLQELLDPVPGPGFSYAHVSALDSDLAIKAVIDPETQWRLAVAERVLRDTSGFATPGYYLLDGGGEYVIPAEPASQAPQQQSQQPQIIVLQQPAPKSAEESAPAAAPQPSAPVPDVGNFTLVLRSGKKIQAIAFTRSGDQIVYITSDGSRRSIAASDLDQPATERLNRDSGTQFTL